MAHLQSGDSEVIRQLEEPWQGERLDQVRTGKIKPVFGLDLRSAIFKNNRPGPVKVTLLGCEGDEHAFEFHGGPDKALLQYSSLHYASWETELPQSADLFVPGGFGENLIARQANERNMCIGDIVRIGGTVQAQVSLPRQPCFKLNHRFQVKDMSRRSQDLFRTGWFYRILREGVIEAGDEMTLLERPYPEWTVARVQYYLYHDMRNEEMMKQLVKVEELGEEARTIFANRLKKQYENQVARLVGDEEMVVSGWREYRLVERKRETPRILSLTFEAADPATTARRVQPGSHIRVKLGGKLVRAYSVVAGDSNRFQLAIALSASSRGGSRFVHGSLKLGDSLSFGEITSSFPLSEDADHHVFIAGGIGLTAFIASAEHCQKTGYSFHLHYLVRDRRDIALKKHLESFDKNVTIYDKSAGKAFNTAAVLGKVNDNTHVYCCGSDRLQTAVQETAKDMGIGSRNLHFETFEVPTSGDRFTAHLADSGKSVEVDAEKSLLDALRDAGLDVPSSCEAGNCGTCRVGVKDGKVQHRGTGLMDNEKCSAMLSCVSRGVGAIVLDL